MVGIGYDSHRFAAGRRLILGGVEIPHELGHNLGADHNPENASSRWPKAFRRQKRLRQSQANPFARSARWAKW